MQGRLIMDSIDPDTTQPGRPPFYQSVTNSIQLPFDVVWGCVYSLSAVGPFLTRAYTIQECR